MKPPRPLVLPKLAPPRRRADTIRRPRLLERLSGAFDYDVVTVSAPAGYGKTTLAVDWASDSDVPVAWLSLDRQDADPLALVTNLVGALRVACPEALGELAARLAAGTRPAEAAALVAEITAAVQNDIDGLVVLVIDDMHLLDGSPAALELCDALVRAVPLNMRLYLLSRGWPPLPSLTRLTAQRRALALTAGDLEFTREEALELLERSGIDEAWSRDTLIHRADGWAAALVILADHYASSGRHATDAGSALASGSFVPGSFILGDFIEQEVLGRLPPGQLTLLEACAVPPAFDAESAGYLATATRQGGHTEPGAAPDIAGLLRDLERQVHFIVRLEDGESYRMHALLREHLLERLERETPERLLTLRRAAAALYARRGDRRGAVELSLEAHDWGEVVRELYELQDDLYQRGEWTTLNGWLDRLPAEVLEAEVDLALLRARLAIKLLQGREGLARLDALGQVLLSPSQRVRQQLFRGVALRQVGRLSDAVDACRRARSLALEWEDEGHPLFAEIALEEGIALAQSGQFEAARTRFEEAATGFEQAGDHRREAEAHDCLGSTLFLQGWLAESMREYTTAQRIWRMLQEPVAQTATMNNMGNVQHMLGELETARDTFQGVIERAREFRHQRYEAHATEGLAAVSRDLGRHDDALALFTVAVERAQEVDDISLVAEATYGMGMSYRERGDHQRARTLLDHGLRAAEQSGGLFHQAKFRAGIGATLLAEKRYREALPLLEQAVWQARECGARREEAVARLLLGGVHFATRKRTKAAEELREVASIVQEVGYDQFLRSEARMLPELIEYGAALRAGGEYFAALRRQLPAVEAAPEGVEETSVAGAPAIRAEAFGIPRVTLAGRQVTDREWRSERSKEMFFYLLHVERPVRKEQIALELWPDLDPKQLNSAFHSTLYRLRRALDPGVVVQTDEGYRVNPTFVIGYDAREFEQHVRAAEGGTVEGEHSEHLAQAVRLYRGAFAEPFESDWAQTARERYEHRYVGCVTALAELMLARDEYEEAIRLAEEITAVDPLNEGAVRCAMRAYARMGRLELAARAYRAYQREHVAEMDEDPPEAMRALYGEVLSGAALDV